MNQNINSSNSNKLILKDLNTNNTNNNNFNKKKNVYFFNKAIVKMVQNVSTHIVIVSFLLIKFIVNSIKMDFVAKMQKNAPMHIFMKKKIINQNKSLSVDTFKKV